jgi:hypothetical protein
LKKINTAVPRGPETYIKAVAISPKIEQETFLKSILKRSLSVRLSSASTPKDIKAIGKIFLLSKMVMAGSLLIQKNSLTNLIPVIVRYLAVSVASGKYSSLTQVNSSLLTLKSLGKD